LNRAVFQAVFKAKLFFFFLLLTLRHRLNK